MSKEKDSKSQVKETNTEVKNEEGTSPWLYFYSVGCGFCKRVDPIVDELIKDGHDILKLDVSDPDNAGLNNEIKTKYSTQCGTPWFINSETGKGVCGYREKDVLEKWLDGEDIPAPPRPKSPMPKPPLMECPKEEEEKWIEDYAKWSEENSHLPNLQTAQQILDRPRPKTEPPKPPLPNFTDEQFDEWGKEYDKWRSKNDHLPNLQPGSTIVQRFKQRGAPGQVQGQASQVPSGITPDQNARIQRLEQKMDKLMKHLGVK